MKTRNAYLPEIDAIDAEARRLGLTVSGLLQRAWSLSREEIRAYPAAPGARPLSPREPPLKPQLKSGNMFLWTPPSRSP